MSGEQRKEHLEKIEKLFSKSKEFGDDKVQLAMQTYEMVNGTLLCAFRNYHLPPHLQQLICMLSDENNTAILLRSNY